MASLLQFFIAWYQRLLSPFLGPCCRFTPSCSDYASQSIHAHGALKGLVLTCGRLLRCHPLARCGFDPVPDTFSLRSLIRKPTPIHGEPEL